MPSRVVNPALLPCRRREFLFATAAMIAGGAVSQSRAHEQPLKPAPLSGFELPQPRALKPFRLIDHRGERFDQQSLTARWTLLLFGFTHCPDVCPTTLGQMADVRMHVMARQENIPLTRVLVTIDPARDTPQRLSEYVARFGPGVTGVTGPVDGVNALANQFRIRYTPTKPIGSAGYLFDHTASVSLLGPDARLYAIFTLPLRSEAVAADIARMHAEHRSTICPRVSGTDATLICAKGTV